MDKAITLTVTLTLPESEVDSLFQGEGCSDETLMTYAEEVICNHLTDAEVMANIKAVSVKEVDTDSAEADAKLIAVAPELLDAMLDSIEETYIDSDTIGLALDALSNIRSILRPVIAKATESK
jgi:hypothetical protein